MGNDIYNGHAHPGDTIEITHECSPLDGQQFVVIEAPSLATRISENGYAWFHDRGGIELCAAPGVYKIISRGAGPCDVGLSDADTSLNKQRDDNLRSIFG